MGDHEAHCAIELGFNWCTCIAYAEDVVARGFALYLDITGQVDCMPGGGHEDWWLGGKRCPWCKAVV